MSQVSDNKRIAKNTVFLYFRMFIIMGVTLYTSRVVLDKLGADDYGLYNVVGGVVAMLGFLNGTLSISTSRFITFELGTGSLERQKRTFSTALIIHLALCGFVFIFLETVGLLFFYNKLVIHQIDWKRHFGYINVLLLRQLLLYHKCHILQP